MTQRTKTPEARRKYYYDHLEQERKNRRDYQRRRRAANPDATRAAAKWYRIINPWPSRRCAWRRQGVNVAAAETRLRTHSGTCDLCGSETPGGKGGWHVDHDHQTGRIRGILCTLCNHALGTIDKISLEKLYSYLKGVNHE